MMSKKEFIVVYEKNGINEATKIIAETKNEAISIVMSENKNEIKIFYCFRILNDTI